MQDKIDQIEWLPNFIKIFIPAFIGVGIKISIEMKKDKTKISFVNIMLSMFIGIGGAWLTAGLIEDVCTPNYVAPMIAVMAIISDKIGEFLIYKFNVDIFLTALFNNLFTAISNTFKKD